MIFSDSLKKNTEFRYIYDNGLSYSNRYLVLYVMKNGTEYNRVGISCSKKQGNSVKRHRFARLVREAYRLNEEKFLSGLDMIFIARRGSVDLDFHCMEKNILHVAKLHHILR